MLPTAEPSVRAARPVVAPPAVAESAGFLWWPRVAWRSEAGSRFGDRRQHIRKVARRAKGLLEVPEVRACLSLAYRHEQAVGADEIVFLADLNVLVIVHAIALKPDRIAGALIASCYRPGARQGVVESGDLGVQN